jgi:hypothetical protein
VILGHRDDKRLAAAIMGGTLVAVLAPLRENWRKPPRDGFPFSYYPMFSFARRKTYRVYHLQAVTADGHRRPLHYSYGGAGGLNATRRQLRRLARAGRGQEVCAEAARRLRERSFEGLEDVVAVELVRGTYRIADYFAGQTEPVREVLCATHAMERDA